MPRGHHFGMVAPCGKFTLCTPSPSVPSIVSFPYLHADTSKQRVSPRAFGQGWPGKEHKWDDFLLLVAFRSYSPKICNSISCVTLKLRVLLITQLKCRPHKKISSVGSFRRYPFLIYFL